jgi:pyruvate kinase
MLRNGMSVARLNFSHGTHEDHKKTIETFRRVRDRLHMPAAVMLDTKGPEIRIGTFKNGKISLSAGDCFTFTTAACEGDETRVSVSYAGLPAEVKPETRLLLDDGKAVLSVVKTTETEVICRVENDCVLSDRKSINIPYTHLNLPFISKRDEEDLLFGIAEDVDFVAASFVRTKEDVIALRKFLDYHGGHRIRSRHGAGYCRRC